MVALDLVFQVVGLLSCSGCPSYKTVEYATEMMRVIGCSQIALQLIPGTMLASYLEPGEPLPTSKIHPLRGGMHLERLELVEIVADSLIHGYYAASSDALSLLRADLETIRTMPRVYTPALRIFAFGSLCITTTFMFNGSLLDSALAFILGCIFGCLLVLSERLSGPIGVTYDCWSSAIIATLASVASSLCKAAVGPNEHRFLNPFALVFPAVIYILPGLSMIFGFTDFLSGFRTLGISNIFNAMFVSFSIGFGTWIGLNILTPLLGGVKINAPAAFLDGGLNVSWLIDAFMRCGSHSHRLFRNPGVAFLISVLSFVCSIYFINISFSTAPRQMIFSIGIPTVAYIFGVSLSHIFPGFYGYIHEAVASSLGGFVAAFLSTIATELTGMTGSAAIFLGVVVFAPGAKGAKCLFLLISKDYPGSAQQLQDMFSVSACIATSVLFGRAVGKLVLRSRFLK